MKRIKYLLITLFLIILAGCADEHVHSYVSGLKSSPEGHWFECECGSKTEVEVHEGGIATCQRKAVCEKCNAEYGELGECKYIFKISNQKHWYECELCKKKKDEEVHSFDAGVRSKEPTDQEDGVRVFTCSSCKYEKEESIPMIQGQEVAVYPNLTNADTVYYDGSIYSYGGNAPLVQQGSTNRTTAIYRYCVTTDKLYQLDVELEIATTSHRVVLVGSKVYIIGGTGASRPTKILVHDLETQTITESGAVLPFGMNCFQFGQYENKIYIVSGTGAQKFDDVYCFDITTDEIIKLDVKLPNNVLKGAWCTVGKYAYIIGGINSSPLDSIYRFNMETYEMETMNAKLPQATQQLRAEYDGEGNIYIYGGATLESEHYWKLDSYIIKYNIESDTAENLSYRLPQVVANACVEFTEYGMFILGGDNDYSNVIIKHVGDEVTYVRTPILMPTK